MREYLSNIFCCFGFAPEIWLLNARNNRPHEIAAIYFGLLLNLLFIMSLLLLLAVFIGGSLILWVSQNAYSPIYNILDLFWEIPLILTSVMFLIGLTRAVFNKSLSLNRIQKLFYSQYRLAAALFVGFVFHLVLLLIVGVYFRSQYLARPHSGPSEVYMLYENVIGTTDGGFAYVPEEIFPIGFYPIAEVSTARWGKMSVSVEPLNRASLLRALKNGRMVFIASHGGRYPGAISLSPDPNNNFFPDDIQAGGGISPKLQFVYIAGCYSGSIEQKWRQSLAPAQVIIFNRISLIIEHVYWLWFKGPGVVSGLE